MSEERTALEPVGAGGYWPVIAERFDPAVVRQTSDLSCVSACGEMLLLKDRGMHTIENFLKYWTWAAIWDEQPILGEEE